MLLNNDDQNRWRETLLCSFDDQGFAVDDASLDRLVQYCALIKKWNPAVRLVGNAAPEEVAVHVVDSVALLKLPLPERLWVDVGSGAGFPGVVLACLRPTQRILLIEPRVRRHVFLTQAIKTLSLSKVEAVRARLEETELSEEVLMMAKALAPPLEFLEMARCAGAAHACVMTNKDGVPTIKETPWREVARVRFQMGARPTRVNLLYEYDDS
jgi:16S rRNA (guanine527-N7)-methyltransferase